MFELPEHFGVVTLTAMAIVALTQWTAMQVTMARKKFGVRYPDMYAIKGCTYRGLFVKCNPSEEPKGALLSDEDVTSFNCFQRAHQNTVEALPT